MKTGKVVINEKTKNNVQQIVELRKYDAKHLLK
jgi:hypothetical protein